MGQVPEIEALLVVMTAVRKETGLFLEGYEVNMVGRVG